jgi:hypothetical protein
VSEWPVLGVARHIVPAAAEEHGQDVRSDGVHVLLGPAQAARHPEEVFHGDVLPRIGSRSTPPGDAGSLLDRETLLAHKDTHQGAQDALGHRPTRQARIAIEPQCIALRDDATSVHHQDCPRPHQPPGVRLHHGVRYRENAIASIEHVSVMVHGEYSFLGFVVNRPAVLVHEPAQVAWRTDLIKYSPGLIDRIEPTATGTVTTRRTFTTLGESVSVASILRNRITDIPPHVGPRTLSLSPAPTSTHETGRSRKTPRRIPLLVLNWTDTDSRAKDPRADLRQRSHARVVAPLVVVARWPGGSPSGRSVKRETR